jgi:hypothetical protein
LGGQRKYSLLFVQTAEDAVKLEPVTRDAVRSAERGLAWLVGAREAALDLEAIDFVHALDQCIERGLAVSAKWYDCSPVRHVQSSGTVTRQGFLLQSRTAWLRDSVERRRNSYSASASA